MPQGLGGKKLSIPSKTHRLVLLENVSTLSQNNEVRTERVSPWQLERTGDHRGLETEHEALARWLRWLEQCPDMPRLQV